MKTIEIQWVDNGYIVKTVEKIDTSEYSDVEYKTYVFLSYSDVLDFFIKLNNDPHGTDTSS